ncbi:uncharacterized protein LOC117563538 [Drosophila albomicans]|uniref:Uncharacterized protein LOC117563538 n=1 Tax=Drosophila albomicans TaxID=7291 RepID=A0A6P8WEW0_DROAB|nr:uncharacterized protein LOC117563538 [Drosophila albomicans]
MWLQIWRSMALLLLIAITTRAAYRDHDVLHLMNLQVYMNSEVPYGKETFVVMAMSVFPRDTVRLRLYAKSYLLAYLLLSADEQTMPPKFEKTRRISNVLKELQIKPPQPVLYETAYFAKIASIFWDTDDDLMTLTAVIPKKPMIPEVTVEVAFKVTLPNYCVPLLKMIHCGVAQNPQEVIPTRSTSITTIFKEKCKIHNVTLTWTIYDLSETELLYSIRNQRMIFTLKRFSLTQVPAAHELWRNLFVIKPQGVYEGIPFMARCYVEMVQSKVEAIIHGGRHREANVADALLMDGSSSRDYSKPKKIRQFKAYHWTCTSEDDYTNRLCRSPMGFKGSKLVIPRDKFLVNCQYDFTLTVAANNNRMIKSKASQSVQMVNYGVLHVSIVCMSNCANRQYNPLNKVRLRARCLNCGTQTIKYAWYVGDQYTLSSENMTMHVRTMGTMANIKVVLQLEDGRKGEDQTDLMKTVVPVGGTCEVNPKAGVEARTPFFVCCSDYVTDHKPIEFFYYADRVLLNKCLQCNCPVHLPHNVNQIKVLICDSLLTCRTNFVDVEVTPLEDPVIDTPEEIWQYITEEPNDIVDMMDRGLNMQFYQTLESLACRLNTAEGGEVLMRAFENAYPESLITLGKLANLTQTFGKRFTPINIREHNLLTKTLAKLNENFQTLYNNRGRIEMTEQPYINVTVACVTVYEMMDRINRKIPRPPQHIYDEYRKAINENKLQQDVIDRLREEINAFDDEEAKNRSLRWLNAKWETERLYRFLDLARQHGLQGDPSEVGLEAVSLEIQCFYIEANRHYNIKTSDSMHVVFFSPELLQETKEPETNYICLKVLSTTRELYWWYPEEKQPSAVLLSVRIYVYEDEFKEERRLSDSDIRFVTTVGKYKPALDKNDSISAGAKYMTKINVKSDMTGDLGIDFSQNVARSQAVEEDDDLIFPSDDTKPQNKGRKPSLDDEEDEYVISDAGRFIHCLESGTVSYMQQVRLYRVSIEGHAMVTVRFKESSHELQVLLYIGARPRSWRDKVSKASCFVPSNSSNKIMLIRNKCPETKRAYMAFQINGAGDYHEDEDTPVPNGPASYAFVFQERSCDYWKYSLSESSQHWSHDQCYPILEFQKKGTLHCECTVLGTYTSYVYHIPATAVPLDADRIDMNMVLLVFYIVIFTLIFIGLLVLVIWFNKRPTKAVICDMSGLNTESGRDVHDLLIFVKTGGRINAQTTATVRLIFQTTQRAELQFTIMQDPEHPQLTRNSTYVLLIRTRDIRIPTRIAVAHNNAGRYPSWFLRRIELVDLQHQMSQVFIVNRWVRQKFLILSSSMVLRFGDNRVVEKWRERFLSSFEVLWINWGLWHPLTGKWRDSKSCNSLSRSQRVCVFVSKMMVIYCIVVCLFGHSSRHSVYEDRKITIKGKDVLTMFIYCSIATNLVHFIFVSIILSN